MICLNRYRQLRSPPSRGAWIEINLMKAKRAFLFVAPLAGGVD